MTNLHLPSHLTTGLRNLAAQATSDDDLLSKLSGGGHQEELISMLAAGIHDQDWKASNPELLKSYVVLLSSEATNGHLDESQRHHAQKLLLGQSLEPSVGLPMITITCDNGSLEYPEVALLGSGYFDGLYRSGMQERQSGQITLEGATREELAVVLELSSTESTATIEKLPLQGLFDVFGLAVRLDLPNRVLNAIADRLDKEGLPEYCVELLTSYDASPLLERRDAALAAIGMNLSPSTAADLWNRVPEHLHSVALPHFRDYIARNLVDVLKALAGSVSNREELNKLLGELSQKKEKVQPEVAPSRLSSCFQALGSCIALASKYIYGPQMTASEAKEFVASVQGPWSMMEDWSSITLSHLSPQELEIFLATLPDCCQSLNLSGATLHGNEESLTRLLPKGLKHLNLSNGAKLDDDDIEKIARQCPHLESLNLSDGQLLTDRAWAAVASLNQLSDVTISNCPEFSGEALQLLARQLPKLDSIDISGNQNLTLDDLTGLIEQRGASLTKLGIANLPIVDDAVLAKIDTHCKGLTDLDISGNSELSPQRIGDTVSKLSGLEVFRAGGCAIDGTVLEKFHSGAHVRVLDLREASDITGQELTALCSQCPQLAELSISRTGIDSGLSEIIDACKGSLRSLDISGCASLTDNDIDSVAGCKRLEELNLSSLNGQVKANTILHIADKQPGLRVLGLSRLKCIGDRVAADLLHDCKNLTAVDLTKTSVGKSGEDWFRNIAAPQLRSLYLSGTPATRLTVGSLVRGAPDLIHLNLSEMRNLEDHRLEEVLSGLHRLRAIDLSYDGPQLFSFSSSTIASIVKNNHYLQQVEFRGAHVGMREFSAIMDLPDIRYVDVHKCGLRLGDQAERDALDKGVMLLH